MSDDRKEQLNQEIAQLVKKLKEGDSLSFERLYELSLPKLTPYAYTLAKKEAEAQDLLQDTYIRILDSIGTLRDDNRFIAWARTIMHNIAMRGYQRSAKESVVTDDENLDLFDKIAENSEEFLPGLDIEKNEVQEAVFEMICDLPVKQRVTLLAFYYDSMKIREIAEMMDCQEGTVKSRLQNARVAMKQKVLAYEKRSGVKIHSIAPFLGPALERYVEMNSMPPAASEALRSRLMDHISGHGIGIKGGSGSGSVTGRTENAHAVRKSLRRAAKPAALGMAAVLATGGMIAAFGIQGDAQNVEGMRTAVNDQIATAINEDVEDVDFSASGVAKLSSAVVRKIGFSNIDLNGDSHDELLMKTEYPGDDSFEILIVDGKSREPEPNIYRIEREKADSLEMYYVPGKRVGRIYVSRDIGGQKYYTLERLYADAPTSSYTDVSNAKEFNKAVGGGDAAGSGSVKIDEAGFRSFTNEEEMSRYTEKQYGFAIDEKPVAIATLFEDRLLTRWQEEPEGGRMSGTAADILGLDMDIEASDIKDAADCNGDMTADISAGTLTLEYRGYCTLTAELDDGKLRPDTLVKLSFVSE